MLAFFARQFQWILLGTPWTTYNIRDATKRLYGLLPLPEPLS